jgi:CubicO group peptidase (beta-lactamase class C family)
MNVLKKTAKWVLIILIVLNITIIISGRTYLYKAIGNTYLMGRSGPTIDESEIFYNREVKAGAEQKWNISKAYNSKKISEENQTLFSDLNTIAFVVIKNDSLMHEQYWDGFGEDSKTNSFSMAKTIVSVLVGIAIDEGKIKSVDQPIGDFLPEFKQEGKEPITIKHLLTMSSGINFDEDYNNPLAYPAQAYYGTDLKKLTYGYKLTEEPGKKYKYLSGNTQLLGFILEKATGKKISEYMSEKLWQPIGAKNTALWNLDQENGEEKAFCCFNSNAKDFARIGKLYLDSGKWNGNQLIRAEYVLNSIQPANLIDYDKGTPVKKYGYSWWLMPEYKGHSIFYAQGILGQYIICIPDKKMVIVRLGKKRIKVPGADHTKDIYYYIDAALEMYGN